MKKIFLLLVFVILGASFIYAQNEENINPLPEADKGSKDIIPRPKVVTPPKFLSGEVLNVDTSNPEVTLLTLRDIDGQESVVEVNPNLSITKIISAVELKAGDNLRVTYEEKDTKKIARNIFLGRPQPRRRESYLPAAENMNKGD